MTAVVLRGDAAHLPLPDASVDLIVTSPPYFGLRSYTDGGEHYAHQIGSEATPAAYVAALIDCTREWMRVLKPSGSLFVNLGDKYAGGDGRNNNGTGGSTLGHHKGGGGPHAEKLSSLGPARTAKVPGQPKSLLGLPWRYALACIDELGLILRAEVIWSKPNGLPESVTDRVRRSHEQLFHFTRLPRYYSAVDEIREQYTPRSVDQAATDARAGLTHGTVGRKDMGSVERMRSAAILNPLGKLPGSVWDIPSQPLTVPPELGVDHFAAFPMELPRRIVLGWSPAGICTACGEGRRPVAQGNATGIARSDHGMGKRHTDAAIGFDNGNRTASARSQWREGVSYRITGYACACSQPPVHQHLTREGSVDCHVSDCDVYQIQERQRAANLPPTRPAVVLDPFGGTGTTALVASAYGRTGITVDRSADYCRLARWRTQDPAQRAAAMHVPKPPAQVNGQLDLLSLTD